MILPVDVSLSANQVSATKWPWVTWTLVALMVVPVLGAMDPAGWAWQTAHPNPANLVTHLFAHADPWHLGSNIWALFLVGPTVEQRLGRLPYLVVFLAIGAGAAVIGGLAYPHPIQLVGASGAIFGIIGLFAVLWPRAQVHHLWLFPWLSLFPLSFMANRLPGVRIPFWPTTFALPAFVIAVYLLMVDNVLPLVLQMPSTTAFSVHIVGAAAGMFLGVTLRAAGLVFTKPIPDPSIERNAKLDAWRAEPNGMRVAPWDPTVQRIVQRPPEPGVERW